MEKKVPLLRKREGTPSRWGRGPGHRYCVPFGWSGLFRCLGAQRPVAPPGPGRGPGFLWKKAGGKNTREEEVLPPWTHLFGPTFSGWGDPGGFSLFFCLACGPVSYVRNGPPPGWAGWGRWFLRREGFFPPPKPSPWGEGAPVRTLGRMRGRSCNQPFLVEKGVTDSRLDVLLLLPRWATRSPPHPSPSVTASPQGEASGLCSPVQPYTKKAPQIRARRWAPK